MLTSKQRAYLRGLATKESSLFHIGKNGLTPEITAAIDEALEARELVKIDVLGNSTEDIRDLAEAIHGRTRSEIVQIIGSKAVLYRAAKKNPEIKLPK